MLGPDAPIDPGPGIFYDRPSLETTLSLSALFSKDARSQQRRCTHEKQLSNAPLFAPSDALAEDEAERLSTHLDALLQADLLGIPESQTIAYLARDPRIPSRGHPRLRARIARSSLWSCLSRSRTALRDAADGYRGHRAGEHTGDTDGRTGPRRLATLACLLAPRLYASAGNRPSLCAARESSLHPALLRLRARAQRSALRGAGRAPEPLAKTELYPALFAGLFSER